MRVSCFRGLTAVLLLLGTPALHAGKDGLGLSDEVVPFEELGQGMNTRPPLVTERIEDAVYPENKQREELLRALKRSDVSTRIPPRKTLFGDGDRFLSPGPTGLGGGGILKRPSARPYWVVHGQFRSGLHAFESGGGESTLEWANRLDLLADYLITPTERFHVGFRPLDDEGTFTGVTFDGEDTGWNGGLNAQPETLFFEGDIGEIFPGLDQHDRLSFDYRFSLGRQPVSVQEGILINDSLDAIGVSRHDLFLLGSSASRLTALWAPGQVHGDNNRLNRSAQLFGLFSSHDFDLATIDFDLAYVSDDGVNAGDGFFTGIGHVRRFGHWNSTFRANGSWALEGETEAVSSGYLFTHELSRTMRRNHDLVYCNTFVGVGEYASAARGPATGGPLGSMGLLYQAVGLGTYEAALGNRADETEGFALGYQHFLDAEAYRQILVELGGRTAPESNDDQAELGVGLRYQQALNQHQILVLDGFLSRDEVEETDYGARAEVRVKF